MRIRAISFTEEGRVLSERLRDLLPEDEVIPEYRKGLSGEGGRSLHALCREAFEEKTALLFIGAMGICVRAIAPFVGDKLSDPPVVVMDERGQFCVPVLSGHMGGANELALRIAEAVEAVPVITTATDVQGAFSVDLFAKEHGLRIANREGIAKVSGKALEGKAITIAIKDYPPKEPVDVVITDGEGDGTPGTIALYAPGKMILDAPGTDELPVLGEAPCAKYVVGVGCKKGKASEALRAFVLETLSAYAIDREDLFAIATIEAKKDEPAVMALSRKWKLPLIVFAAEVLKKAEGDFASSEFVARVVGVDNVCERAAVLAAGRGSKLIVRKQARDGMTVAVAVGGCHRGGTG